MNALSAVIDLKKKLKKCYAQGLSFHFCLFSIHIASITENMYLAPASFQDLNILPVNCAI